MSAADKLKKPEKPAEVEDPSMEEGGDGSSNNSTNGDSNENNGTDKNGTGGINYRRGRERPTKVAARPPGDPQRGIMRGIEILAESEMEESFEEIKRLDTQMDHLNECVGKLEERVEKHNEKIQGMINEQKESRLKRRASFQQRLQQSKEEDADWNSRVKEMLSKCNQTRRVSVVDFDTNSLLAQSQAARAMAARED